MSRDEHPLLNRLLRRVGASAAEVPPPEVWRDLLALVARTYHEADQDRYTLERSIDISSREMQGLYQDLKRRTDKALEESYAILRATHEAASEGIIAVDRQRNIIASNRRFWEIFGIPSEDIDKNDHRALVKFTVESYVDPAKELARIEAIHATSDTFREFLELRDGRTMDRYSAPICLPDGTVVGRVTFLRDITAERTAHLQLDTARRAAEAASNAKSMFLANMSHELRTPLNAAIGLAELMLVDTGDPVTTRQRDYIENIAQSGRHLLALVNDVLDLAKIEVGKDDLELEVVGVRDALEEAVTGLLPLAHARGVSLASAVPRDVREVRVDRVRFRQILFNLISNALKFTDRGGQVIIGVKDDGGGIAIAIQDSGIGIADSDRSRLFQAFEQLSSSSGDRPQGTGLGLALTKQLVLMHGGTIDVESEVGVGSTFTVRMPAA